MSMLLSDLDMPKYSKTAGTQKKFSNMMFLKPNKGTEYYRFRLLKIDGSDVGRDHPFIVRHIHDHWSVNDKGIKLPDDTVVCLKTKYVDYNGNRYNDCPMCNHANENFGAWKSSGYRDPVSGGKFNAMKEKFQAIIPVYVVNDPNSDPNDKYTNNGRMKCIMFTKKSRGKNDPVEELCYDDFIKVVNEEIIKAKKAAEDGNPYSIWNNKNAVDLCIRMDEKPIVVHPGEANEYTYNAKIITNIQFTKNPWDIPEITNEAVDKLDFDQYYVSNTPAEIEAFYRKHYAITVPKAPDEDIDMGFTETNKENKPSISTPSEIVVTPTLEVDTDLDDMFGDDLPEENAKPKVTKPEPDPLAVDDENELDGIINGLE